MNGLIILRKHLQNDTLTLHLIFFHSKANESSNYNQVVTGLLQKILLQI